jgi:erythritol kinase (D-erythritol 1-phosphate-forming)
MKIGLDVGTSLTKVVLFGASGEQLARHAAPTPSLRTVAGTCEFDVEQLADATFHLLRCFAGEDIELIALTGQGDGLWLIDEAARAVRPALGWLDARGASICDAWERSGVLAEVFAQTGNAPFPGAGGALLRALDDSEPESLETARTATQCQHVLFERLTGLRTATASCAMLPLFAPAAGDYDQRALELTGLSGRRGLLPPISPTPVCKAPMRDDLAELLGLPRGVTVATGPYDLPAAAFGVGPLAPGDGVLILGTTLACQVLVDRLPSGDQPVGLTLCTGDGAGWLRAMPAMVGTACFDWVLGLVGSDATQLGRLLADSPAGARGVSALPFFALSGERAPFSDHAARAELTGLHLETTAADVVRAVCEALGFAARHCFGAAGLQGKVMVCGGGAGSRALVQLLADILERPLTLAGDEEPAARGAVAAADGSARHNWSATPGRVQIQPRREHPWAEAYADYLGRLQVARQYHWHRSEDGGAT